MVLEVLVLEMLGVGCWCWRCRVLGVLLELMVLRMMLVEGGLVLWGLLCWSGVKGS